MSAKTERFEMRLDQTTIENIDSWRSSQNDLPSRAEAVRRLINTGLTPTSITGDVNFTDGDKMILTMLCQLQKGLNIETELDPKFIEEVIHGGHYWALNMEYTGIFHDHIDKRKSVTEVINFLDMWLFLEEGYNKLSIAEKKRIKEETGYSDIKFIGFDGNNECEHMQIAIFLVKKMGRFESFKDRDFNSHAPSIAGYKRMYAIFEKTRETLIGRTLSSEKILQLINARKHK